jgi:diacylglycerol O-acyltransferase / wax synthase
VPPPPPSGSAPPTPFNGSITAHRRLALRSTPLGGIKAIKNALGVTLNDVLMAVCAGALRAYLLSHEALPDRPLVAAIPVSIRTGEEEDRWTNRVSSIFASIPTDVAQLLDRVGQVHAAMDGAKTRFALMPADVLTLRPVFTTRACDEGDAPGYEAAGRRSAQPAVQPGDLKRPGTETPLYLAGARLQHYYPVSTITEGQGVNITVQSYLDTLDFALVACRELLPDVDDLADLLLAEIEALATAAGLTPAAVAVPAPEPAAEEAPPSAPVAAAPAVAPARKAKARKRAAGARASGVKGK